MMYWLNNYAHKNRMMPIPFPFCIQEKKNFFFISFLYDTSRNTINYEGRSLGTISLQ